jgi:DNA-binding transcriptional MerR regulator
MTESRKREAKRGLPAVDTFWVDDDDIGMAPGEPATLTINDVSKRLGVPARAIRDYARRGLLGPQRQSETFSLDRADIRRIAAVVKARRLGFTFGEIKDMFCSDEERVLAQVLRLNRNRCMKQIEALASRRAEIEQALGELWQVHNRLSAYLAGRGDAGPPAMG